MIMNYKKDKSVKLILNGYFEFHKFICPNKDCISKKESYYTNKSAKLLMDQGEKLEYIKIILLIQSQYLILIKKFPQCIKLRLFYSLYILDIMNNDIAALQEFIELEKKESNFPDKIIIGRLYLYIDEKVKTNYIQLDTNKKKQNDISNQNIIKNCIKDMEISSYQQYLFWT
jgi:hypothetical protein